MTTRTLTASVLLLASVLAGAPGAAATPLPPAAAPASAAPSTATGSDDDQAGTDGIGKGTRAWTCRNFGFWCD